jgi:UDP-N-acetylmuramoyl-L-alanyl-D-glutamate--2,6-diaminopimelate ligase
MRLYQLLKDILPVPSSADHDVAYLELDSRQVKPGTLFLAVKGADLDGGQFIEDALAKGAVAALSVTPEQVGQIAERFYGEPAKQLKIIGVTGTNGKTSCTHYIAQVYQEPIGVIGTLGSGIYGALGEPGLTTPDAITLQKMLRQFVDQGVKVVAMEVSSHSIAQARISGIEFETAIFTNLTQDHLDYHGTMEAYAAVKRRFLAEFPLKQVIINADDTYGKKWIGELAHQKSVFAYSAEGVSDGWMPAFAGMTTTGTGMTNVIAGMTGVSKVNLSLEGINATVHTPWGSGDLSIPLIGRFNLSNALAVLTAACLQGIPFDTVLKRLAQLKAVPGRMQTLGGNGQPLIVVDYAHTPDALENVLLALKSHTKGRLMCVFGCGGDRDSGKRPLMAAIAEKIADQVIVTSDNPRHESAKAIADDIMRGFKEPARVFVELDRSKAIKNSIQWAKSTDCVLIAGKGAERYQQMGDEKLPFDDVEQVLENLNASVVK